MYKIYIFAACYLYDLIKLDHHERRKWMAKGCQRIAEGQIVWKERFFNPYAPSPLTSWYYLNPPYLSLPLNLMR